MTTMPLTEAQKEVQTLRRQILMKRFIAHLLAFPKPSMIARLQSSTYLTRV